LRWPSSALRCRRLPGGLLYRGLPRLLVPRPAVAGRAQSLALLQRVASLALGGEADGERTTISPRRLASVPMTPFDRLVGLPLLHLHQRVYELTDGRWGHSLGRVRMLLLRTTGRKSGQQRTAALLYHEDGDQLIVVGSKGGSDTPPAWLLNLQANPEVEVQLGTQRLSARARIATVDEQRRLWPIMTALWPDYDRYQTQSSRRIPLVVLEPGTR
jgi:deazaflavin-dependent oxidoreductase (nitroreductase family)